jgi:hypothetical protein
LFALLIVSPAMADVGVHPILPGGSGISPGEETPIQMVAETVVMTVRVATKADNAAIKLNPEAYGYQDRDVWFSVIAKVQADFTMKNPTNEAVSLTAWFPLASVLKTYGWQEVSPEEIVPRIESFLVTVGGRPVDYGVSELPNPNGADKPLLPWASFPVTFPAGKETMIHVSYVLPLHQLPKSNALALYYIFQTGAGWAGPIGQAELILNLPYPASKETLAGMPSGSLNPPYFVYFGDEVAGIPPGGVLEGNQARWMWKDFEPGPQDDFSILLLQPESWEGLQAARAAVKTKPDDGQAWLKLCASYHSMGSHGSGQIPTGWGETYRLLAVQACQEAAHLLPGDAAPHYGLAMFYLLELSKNPSPEELQRILDELKIGQELEAVQPPSEVFFYGYDEYSSMSEYLNSWVNRIIDKATATAEWAARSTDWAEETATTKALSMAEPSATTAPTLKPTPTRTPVPSATPQPMPTATASMAETGGGQAVILGIIGIAIILVIAGFLIVKRLRSGAG